MSEERTFERAVHGNPVHVAPLTPAAASALCAFATSLGFGCARIDLAGCRDKGDFLTRVAAALEFPEWFGGNWDALFDCLTDLGWRPAAGYLLVFEHAAELRCAGPETFDTALAILGDAGAAWHERNVPFRVFVDSDVTAT
jgi:RNAse (barnase) inhibitor barstar